jgi:hypothetical protein
MPGRQTSISMAQKQIHRCKIMKSVVDKMELTAFGQFSFFMVAFV